MTDHATNVHKTVECIVDLVDDIREHFDTLLELGVRPEDALPMFKEHGLKFPEIPPELRSFIMPIVASALREIVPVPGDMREHIDQLFANRGKKLDDSSTPAIEGITIAFRAGGMATGILSKTPQGLLKLGTIGQMGNQGPEVLLEQVFEATAVLWVATTSPITRNAPTIITTH